MQFLSKCGDYSLFKNIFYPPQHLFDFILYPKFDVLCKLCKPFNLTSRSLHDNFVIVPADKASNNVTMYARSTTSTSWYRNLDFIYFLETLHSIFSASEVFDNHKAVLISFGIQTSHKKLYLPYIKRIPTMHKNLYKHRLIAGSSKYSTMPLSVRFSKFLKDIKQRLQKCCETAYSRSGIIQMWIRKNSKNY